MQIIKSEPHRVRPDRRDPSHAALALAADRLALLRPVALNLCTGTHDPQIFGGQIVALSVLETDTEQTAIVSQPDFDWPMVLLFTHPSSYLPARQGQLPRSRRFYAYIQYITLAWNFCL